MAEARSELSVSEANGYSSELALTVPGWSKRPGAFGNLYSKVFLITTGRRWPNSRVAASATPTTWNSMTTHLEATADEYESALLAMSAGDLTRRVDPDSETESMESVGRNITEALDALESTIADMKSFADEVVPTSDQVSRNADPVGQASGELAGDGPVSGCPSLRSVPGSGSGW